MGCGRTVRTKGAATKCDRRVRQVRAAHSSVRRCFLAVMRSPSSPEPYALSREPSLPKVCPPSLHQILEDSLQIVVRRRDLVDGPQLASRRQRRSGVYRTRRAAPSERPARHLRTADSARHRLRGNAARGLSAPVPGCGPCAGARRSDPESGARCLRRGCVRC